MATLRFYSNVRYLVEKNQRGSKQSNQKPTTIKLRNYENKSRNDSTDGQI